MDVGAGIGRWGAALSLLAATLATSPSAAADEVTVAATSGNSFVPARVTIAPNDAVIWRNIGGEHNVRFDDGAFEQPADPSSTAWTTPARVFPTPARFTYYCERHGGPDLAGMSGRVVVEAAGAADTVAPSLTRPRLRVSGRRLAFRFLTDEAGKAVVRLRRRIGGHLRPVRTLRRAVEQGKVAVRFRRDRRGRILAPGRYRASVTVRDAADNTSRPAMAVARIKLRG